MAEYIDRQAVLDAIFPEDPENDGSDGCTVVLQNQSFTSADIEGIVCSIPAEDVRPVVHAKWIKQDNSPLDGNYYCEACGHGVDIATGEETPIDRDLLYCPHCGAQMDGDKNGY
ncbi:hypothetical protein [uncultured Subdoligranulum sp.]|uniref:hypothetical protein n=1 Tax=uncultured Subdoligranulum sp. TaxID=512298 RepID=UPI00260E9B3D|nr:hypothetical protein [uncultured Subdoligranulum sp.]